MTKIFISHAVKDKKLVDSFVDLLVSGMNVDYNDIFCSSEGRLPSGEFFTENIKKHLKESKVVMFLLTPNFFKSKFCLNEMGAAWVLNKKNIPIIVFPPTFKVLEDTALKGAQARKYRDKNDLSQIFDEIISLGIINNPVHSRFQKKLEEFIGGPSNISGSLNNLKTPFTSPTQQPDYSFLLPSSIIPAQSNSNNKVNPLSQLIPPPKKY